MKSYYHELQNLTLTSTIDKEPILIFQPTLNFNLFRE